MGNGFGLVAAVAAAAWSLAAQAAPGPGGIGDEPEMASLSRWDRAMLRLEAGRARATLARIAAASEVGSDSLVEAKVYLSYKGKGAWSRGDGAVVIGFELAKALPDDELAMVLAHELAHALMRDAASKAPAAKAEARADRIGAALAVRAGFDPNPKALREILAWDGAEAESKAGHASAKEREKALAGYLEQAKSMLSEDDEKEGNLGASSR